MNDATSSSPVRWGTSQDHVACDAAIAAAREEGAAAERERIRVAAQERLDLLGPDDFSPAAQAVADILLITMEAGGG